MGFSVSSFTFIFRLLTGVGPFVCFIITVCWFVYGEKDTVLEDLDVASRVWVRCSVAAYLVGILLAIIIVAMFHASQIMVYYLLIFSSIMILNTGIVFWLTGLFFSPPNVEYVVKK